MTREGETLVRVVAIYDYPRRSHERHDFWEVWGAPQSSAQPTGHLTPWTYYTYDPMVADTARQAQFGGWPLRVAWRDTGMGPNITGCERA